MTKFSSKFNFLNFNKFDDDKKRSIINNIFSSVHNKYDIMNDLMSLGLHRIWKKYLINSMSLRRNMKVLDLACGTCDLAQLIIKQIEKEENLFMLDLNYKMLRIGKNKCVNKNITKSNIIQGDVQNLPFKNNYFDRICISFGFRNVVKKELALNEINRCLKTGGKFFILEFAKPNGYVFNKIYDLYQNKKIPNIGELISSNRYSYEYLAKSIRKYPDQERIKQLMIKSGFYNVKYKNLTNGIVSIHYGNKCY